MNKKYFPLLSIALLFTACSAYQMQEAASQDVRKIRKSLTAARKEIKALSPSLVTDIKKVNEKEFASIAEKLSYIEKETLKLKVNQANQLRDTGGVAETLEEISSKLEEYNHRVSTITQRLDSIDSRISQLSDVYQTIAGNTEGNASDKKLTRERENMRWTNMGDSILAIQADLAELKTHIDALQAKKGKKSKGPKGKNPPPPFKATLKPPAAVVVPKTPPKRKEVDVTGKLKPLSRIINITPEELYNTAYKDYLKGNFDLSITEFDQYVKKYPDTEASANAR
ncbi:MAG: hypothetical protein ACE5FU_12280, partial [Nitrospinota bacterium]